MKSYTIQFVRYIMGMRGAFTSDTEVEMQLLERYAAKSHIVAEVGVFEGVASARMAKCLPEDGHLILIDPFYWQSMLEKIFRFSMTEYIARREVAPYIQKIQFVRSTSMEAAQRSDVRSGCDFVFIDARHDYESVLQDFKAWGEVLTPGGVMAFHDSRRCGARPDLADDTGSVRLMEEIRAGHHGAWEIVDTADSITVIRQK